MLERWSREVRIALAEDGLAVQCRRRWRRGSERLAERQLPAGAEPAVVEAVLLELLAEVQARGQWARLWVADAWLRHWVVTPPVNATRLDDCRAAASLRFERQFGEPLDGWCWSADWQARAPFLASAMPLALREALQRPLQALGLAWVSCDPALVAHWNRWAGRIPQGHAFGLVQGGVLTLALTDGRRLRELRRLPVQAGQSSLRQDVARAALGALLPAPAGLCLVGEVPAAWEEETPEWHCQRLDPAPDAEGTLSPALRLLQAGGRP